MGAEAHSVRSEIWSLTLNHPRSKEAVVLESTSPPGLPLVNVDRGSTAVPLGPSRLRPGHFRGAQPRQTTRMRPPSPAALPSPGNRLWQGYEVPPHCPVARTCETSPPLSRDWPRRPDPS